MLSSEAKVPLNPVHYRGGAPALQDVVGGHIGASVNPTSESMPLHQAGSIRILASPGRSARSSCPMCRPMAEQGFNVVIDSWLGVFLPAKVPDDVLRALSAAMREASQSAVMKDSLAKFGSTSTFPDPGAVHRADQGTTSSAGVRW
jgi:tripartite-type tricarboxylate transporter receptor subunit TctC